MNGVYRIVFVQGRGFGWFTPGDWAEIPHWERGRVHVLATVETEEEAKRMFAALPQTWERPGEPPGLHYQDGEWWTSTGVHVVNPQGQDMELFAPLDRPLPVSPAAMTKLITPPG